MPTEEIIVLANSKKLGGRCVAGISTGSRRWVRPVSSLPHGQLEEHQCRVDGRLTEPLDVIRFDYTERCDDPTQPENLLADDTAWDLVDVIEADHAYDALQEHLAPGPELLGNRGKAVKDEIAEAGVEASLALVEPTGPVEFVLRPPEETRRRLQARASFELDGIEYELPITDFVVKPRVLRAGVGTHAAEDLDFAASSRTLLTVSLAELHNRWHTKLVAAVLFLP